MASESDPNEHIEREFERLRPYLLRVAYSHLGSLSEAEDLVQEAWVRLLRAERGEIRDLRAWLTLVVSRLALDALTSARARRERYVGPWLPEPVIEGPAAIELDPAGHAELDESVSMALLIVLESLSPAERSAFLLHDVFGYSFGEVAEIVGRTPAATRQLASRTRHAVEARRPRYPAGAEEQRELLAAFLVAMSRHFGARLRGTPIEVNGAPGLLLETSRSPSVMAFTIDGGRIRSIDIVRNPHKLAGLRLGRG
jgi:RNA polymerase sigma-70 factor (ECF subfamily)